MWRQFATEARGGAAARAVVGAVVRLWRAVATELAAERGRWPLWLPVGVGAGAGLYFALPFEPPLASGPAALAGLAIAAIAGRRRPAVLLLCLALGSVALGFAAAGVRTATVAAPVLARRLGPVEVRGRIAHVDVLPKGARLVLDDVAVETSRATPARLPRRVRLRVGGAGTEGLVPGRRVAVRAVLLPPPGPVVPGAFDFQRHLFFAGIGAVGYALGAPRPLPGGEVRSWRLALAALRQRVGDRVAAALEGATGAVARALMTGERKAIPADVLGAMRDSGLAHLLAISGLHIGLVAGVLFFAVRASLTAAGSLALRLNVKKWAAVAALVGAFGYLLMSGATVPTQRAYLMLGLVLLGVLLDRTGISMRLVAWAALVVLLVSPESLLGVSFQMSFAAVVALVAVYEVIGARLAAWRRERAGWMRPLLYLGGVALTSLVAAAATGPFAAYHFNRWAAYGLAANLVAVPLTGLWIMPWAVLAFALMPLGLEGVALAPMGWGVDAVIAVARTVAGWKGAVVLSPAMPDAGVLLVAAGGLWLALWRRRWRLAGVPVILAGLATVWAVRPPDILVSGDGRLVAVRTGEGRLAFSSASADRFSAEAWLRRSAEAQKKRRVWPWEGGHGPLACDALGCVYRRAGRTVALARDARALADDCRLASVLVSVVPVRGPCPGPRLVIDRFDLWRNGAYALWIGEDGLRVENARGIRGERPWVLKPERAPRKRRRRVRAAGL